MKTAIFVMDDYGVYQPWLQYAGGAGWYGGSSLTLYIVSPTTGGFTTQQISDIETALSNWNVISGSSLDITNSVMTSTPTSFPAQYILVQFGDTSACNNASACTQATYSTITGNTAYATTTVSTSVGTNRLLGLMVHEVGHTYLFDDCPSDMCTSLTVMVPLTSPTSPEYPACCDLDLEYFITPTNPYGAYCTD